MKKVPITISPEDYVFDSRPSPVKDALEKRLKPGWSVDCFVFSFDLRHEDGTEIKGKPLPVEAVRFIKGLREGRSQEGSLTFQVKLPEEVVQA